MFAFAVFFANAQFHFGGQFSINFANEHTDYSSGTRFDYPDKVVTTSSWDLHKGGFAGIAQGLADYGIGLVRKF